MKFNVTYLDKDNNRLKKVVEYDNKNILIEHFRNKNYKLINISYIKSNTKRKIEFGNKKLKEDDISEFLKQFSILLKSGIDVKSAIVTLKEQETNLKLKDTLSSIEESLNLGSTLSKAFEKTKKFPALTIGIIESGEISSNLSESLEILSNHYDHEKKIKQNIKNALYYPIILLAVTFLVVIGIVTFVLPNYIKLFDAYDNLELPFMTQMLINMGNFVENYNIIFLLILLIVIFLGRILLTYKRVKYYISKSLLKIPFLGKYILNLEVLRLSGIMQILLNSGIDLINIIEVSSKSLKNEYLKFQIENSKSDILKGNTLYESIGKINILPPMFLNLINVGEKSSNLTETMKIAFEYYQNLVSHQGKKLTALFEPVIIIFVSLIVGSIVIAIALPTFNLVNII